MADTIKVEYEIPEVPSSYETYFYQQIKAELTKRMPELKRVSLWNNQFQRYSKENSWGFPCVFIQFTPQEHQALLRGVQCVEYTITFHLAVESYLDEDLRIWDLKQRLHKVVNYFVCPNWTLPERTNERPDFDHDAYQVYEMDFRTVVTDHSDDDRPNTPATVTPVLAVEVKKANEL